LFFKKTCKILQKMRSLPEALTCPDCTQTNDFTHLPLPLRGNVSPDPRPPQLRDMQYTLVVSFTRVLWNTASGLCKSSPSFRVFYRFYMFYIYNANSKSNALWWVPKINELMIKCKNGGRNGIITCKNFFTMKINLFLQKTCFLMFWNLFQLIKKLVLNF
jgi:hypothetical protein